MLKQNFNLVVTTQRVMNKEKQVSWRVYIPKHQMPLFVSLIKPYVLESMSYKLGEYASEI